MVDRSCSKAPSPQPSPASAGEGARRRFLLNFPSSGEGRGEGLALWFAAILTLCILLGTNPTFAAVRLTDPWPSVDPIAARVVDVTFASTDPFSPRDIGRAPPRIVSAKLFMPRDTPPDRSTPAVVLLHGSGGLIDQRDGRYGRELAAQGVAVLAIATYDSRSDLATDFISRVMNITETMFVADAYAGLRFLASLPEIDAAHVVLAGFSYGGMATTYALYAQIADGLAPGGPRCAGHVAFYGPCIARFDDSRTTGAPLLMLYGAGDELMIPARCAEVAGDLRAGGSDVHTIVYEGAVHQWDGAMGRRLIGRHLGACRLTVGRDGSITDRRTLLPMNGPFTRKIVLGLCTDSQQYPIGRDEAVREKSNRDFGAFLTRVFAAPRFGG